MLEIAAEIILDHEVALVDRCDEGQRIHVLEDRALVVVHDGAVAPTPRQAGDAREIAAFGDLLDGEIKLVACHEIDRVRSLQALLWLDRDLGADQTDLEAGLERLERLGGAHVGGERRRRGMHHHEIAARCLRYDVLELEPVRRRVDELRAFDQRGRLREPGRVPERSHLAAHLIARASAAIEAVE